MLSNHFGNLSSDFSSNVVVGIWTNKMRVVEIFLTKNLGWTTCYHRAQAQALTKIGQMNWPDQQHLIFTFFFLIVFLINYFLLINLYFFYWWTLVLIIKKIIFR
jgi:hypothetical protein